MAANIVDKDIIGVLVEDNIVATSDKSISKDILVSDNLVKYFS